MEFSGYIKDGKLHLNNQAAFRAWTAAQKDGTQVRLTVKRRVRSLSQNAYMWAAVIPPVAEYTGYTEMETHELLKAMFLGREVVTFAGQEVVRTKSTSSLSTDEFANYLEQIMAWAASEGIVIQSPGEA